MNSDSDKNSPTLNLMKALNVTVISTGLAHGRTWVLSDPLRESRFEGDVRTTNPEAEKRRLESALTAVTIQQRITADEIGAQMNEDLAEVFRTHGMMLESLLHSREFCTEIEVDAKSAEAAVRQVFERWEAKFLRIENPVFRSKADNLADLFRRILRELSGQGEKALCERIPPGSIFVTPRLLPSDVVGLSRKSVEAIIVEHLAKGSHAALLTREKGIPTFAGVSASALGPPGTVVFADSLHERLIIDPDEPTQAAFEERLRKYETGLDFCQTRCRQPAKTDSGEIIAVMANIGSKETAEAATHSGADGVGLFRLEQLYLDRTHPPESDEIFSRLRDILLPFREKPVTIRLLDIGGDKVPRFLAASSDRNPLLGRRGVRHLLAYPALLRAQLCALLRLTGEMQIKILVPMVTLVSDMESVRVILDDLLAHEPQLPSPPPLGAMIETPAAALQITDLCASSDFFSIGSNDLTQYTLAADRENSDVNDYYHDSHPAVMSLIRTVIESAGDKPVTLCGELAGKLPAIPELVKMGLRTLSVAPIQIPAVKEHIRTL